MHAQVGGSHRESVESHDDCDGVGCAPDGHRHTQACIDPCTNMRETDPKALKHTWAHECMQPPAQVVTLFVCPATLVDLTNMAQATCDPRGPHNRPPCCSVQKKNRGLIDGCSVMQLPPSATSLVRVSMVARTALANFTAALRCARRCRHNANMSTITATSAFSETLPHSPPPAPLPSPSSSPFPPPFNHVNSFRFSITRTCTRTPPFAHPLPARACRIPVGPFL